MTIGTNEIDVAIVGGGPAGLTTAYRLRDQRACVRVFEQEQRVGGRTRTAVVGGEVVNTGAVFVYLGTETERLCAELGVEWLPVEPRTYGVHYKGETVIAYDSDQMVRELPLSPAARSDLARIVDRIRADYADYTERGLTEASSKLSSMSFTEYLGDIHPEVREVIGTGIVGGSTGTIDTLSAQYGLRYFASYLMHDTGHRGYIPGGMQEICNALLRRLDDGVVQLGSRVKSVELRGDERYDVHVRHEDHGEAFVARHVVIAVPSPIVDNMVPWLPSWKRDAIARVEMPSSVTLCVVLDSSGLPNWDDLFVINTVGTSFQLVVKPKAGPAFLPGPRARTYVSLYRQRLPADVDTPSVADAWLDELYRVVPEASGRVVDTLLTRWDHGFAPPAPNRNQILEDLRAPFGHVYFAGDYTSATAGSHGAFCEGNRVAAEVAAAIRVPSGAGDSSVIGPDG